VDGGRWTVDEHEHEHEYEHEYEYEYEYEYDEGGGDEGGGRVSTEQLGCGGFLGRCDGCGLCSTGGAESLAGL